MKLFDLPELAVEPAMQKELLRTFVSKIQIRGDFPSSLTLLEKIYQLIDSGQSSSAEIASMVRVDHLLALRLISIVNHEHYRQGRAIYSVSAAVDHLGLLKLKDILPGLAEAKNFNAIFLGHAAALGMMQQAILASVIARNLGEKLAPRKEIGDLAYLTSVISNIGPLLLSFYRPQLFSVLTLSCRDDYDRFKDNFIRYLGVTLGTFAEEVAIALALPEEFVHLAGSTDLVPWEPMPKIGSVKKFKEILLVVRAGNLIAHEICHFTGIQGVQSIMRLLEEEAGLDEPVVEEVLRDVAGVYIDHTETLFLKPVRLPEYLHWFGDETQYESIQPWQDKLPKINQRINPYLYDLRICMKSASSQQEYPLFPQAIHLTLETLVKGLNFDRAVFFRVDGEQNLSVGISAGVKLFQPETFTRTIPGPEHTEHPDSHAFHKRMPGFNGTPIFPEGWPFAAFPAIWRDKVIGMFYADKIRKPDVDALSNQEQLACTALAEEWRDLPAHLF